MMPCEYQPYLAFYYTTFVKAISKLVNLHDNNDYDFYYHVNVSSLMASIELMISTLGLLKLAILA